MINHERPLEVRVELLEKLDVEKDQRITALEEDKVENDRRMTSIEESYKRLESTIMAENRETRLFFQSNMDKQWELIKARDANSHSLKMSANELAKHKLSQWTEIILRLSTVGGIIYLLADNLMNK